MQKIPIFIISHNRLEFLKRSIKSFRETIGDDKIEIVISDNNSTYKPLLEYLSYLEKEENIRIFRYRWREDEYTASFLDIKKMLQQTINSWYNMNDSDFYIVTDPDIELDYENDRDILSFYKQILLALPEVEVVGPMLIIDDIPDCYHMKKIAIKRHTKDFWNNAELGIKYNSKIYKTITSQIDTTFGMYRKGYLFKSPSHAIRSHKPFLARHLDWYIDSDNLTEEQIFYIKNSNDKITHWGGKFMKDKL